MTLGSLFAGIGGFELAATWAGITPIWSNEIDRFPCKVLRKNFTHEIIQKDIREIGKANLPRIDIISAGFPCQPFSQAGKRKGTDDDRYFWPETLRIVQELRPPWFIGENVAGLLSMAQPIWESWVESKTRISEEEEDVVVQRAEWYVLNRIIQDIEEIGYQVQVFCIPAAAVGARHKRNRVWIIANSQCKSRRKETKARLEMEGEILDRRERNKNSIRSKSYRKNAAHSKIKNDGGDKSKKSKGQIQQSGISSKQTNVSNADSQRQIQCRPKTRSRKKYIKGSGSQSESFSPGSEQNWAAEPELGRVAHGIPNRMDRIKGLGNAIVPQVAYEIFKAIVDVELLRSQD